MTPIGKVTRIISDLRRLGAHAITHPIMLEAADALENMTAVSCQIYGHSIGLAYCENCNVEASSAQLRAAMTANSDTPEHLWPHDKLEEVFERCEKKYEAARKEIETAECSIAKLHRQFLPAFTEELAVCVRTAIMQRDNAEEGLRAANERVKELGANKERVLDLLRRCQLADILPAQNPLLLGDIIALIGEMKK